MYNSNNYYQPSKNMGLQPNQMYQQPIYQPMYQLPISQPTASGLLGKMVDSIDVVKAMDIPLDGISYFPLTDGSAIVTKKIGINGTSEIVVYKPINDEQVEVPKYATLEDIRKEIKSIDLSDIDDLKEELRDLKKQFKDLKKKGE